MTQEKQKKFHMLSSASLVVLVNLSVRQQCLLWIEGCTEISQFILVRRDPKSPFYSFPRKQKNKQASKELLISTK